MKTFFEMTKILEQEKEKIVVGNENEKVEVDQETDLISKIDNTETPGDLKHYMFFNNLKNMKDRIEEILNMNVHEIDQMLSDGHDWASDHVSTSRDDIEEVYNWITGVVK